MVLYGGAGADIVLGDDGLDTLYGGADEDTFLFLAASAFNDVDVIKDFVKDIASVTEDVINIKDLLIGYSSTSSTITDFLMMTTSGSDTLVSVDRNGTGTTYSMAQIAKIEAVTGLADEAALLTAGNILAA